MRIDERLIQVDPNYQTFVDPNEVIAIEEDDEDQLGFVKTKIFLRGGGVIRSTDDPTSILNRLRGEE